MFDTHMSSSDGSKMENGLWYEHHQKSDIVGTSWVPPQPPMRVDPLRMMESPDTYSFSLSLFTNAVSSVTVTVVAVP